MNHVKLAAFDINFDSLGEAYGYPANFRDTSYGKICDRFLAIAEKHKILYTIFVIGKDLENREIRAIVKDLASAGHEIGNHSWSHTWNLGALSKGEIRQEVELAHDMITRTIGTEPKGFISPVWNTSCELLEVLIDLNYVYDTSSFPSWVMYALLAKVLFNFRQDKRCFKTLDRRDYLCPFLGQRNAFISGGSIYGGNKKTKADNKCGIRVLPLPTNRYRLACWHTLVFPLGWKLYEKLLLSCLQDVSTFYYLMHPADMFDRGDLVPGYEMHWERLNYSLEQKQQYLDHSIELILKDGRKIVTMKELALASAE